MRAFIFLFLSAASFCSFSQHRPDYSNLNHWAAHPLKTEVSDTPSRFTPAPSMEASADVFFLHPTSYTENFGSSPWNAALDDAALNEKTDKGSVLNQATAFQVGTRLFAPRYRQAHLKAFFLVKNRNRQPALDTAYADLREAFLYYLKHFNNGRPVIIASHSQGTYHAIRLLKEFFDGKPLQKNLICAYLVGWPVTATDFSSIPMGTAAQATGCYVTWRCYADGYKKRARGGAATCVNPITWTTGEEWSTPQQHKGAATKNLKEIRKGMLQARVYQKGGILWVKIIDETASNYKRTKNYHILDYNLFYLDIKENAALRIKVWLDKN